MGLFPAFFTLFLKQQYPLQFTRWFSLSLDIIHGIERRVYGPLLLLRRARMKQHPRCNPWLSHLARASATVQQQLETHFINKSMLEFMQQMDETRATLSSTKQQSFVYAMSHP